MMFCASILVVYSSLSLSHSGSVSYLPPVAQSYQPPSKYLTVHAQSFAVVG